MGDVLMAEAQHSIQGSITRDDPIPSPHLADDPQHIANSVHLPLDMQVRMNLLSCLLAHTEERDTVWLLVLFPLLRDHSHYEDLGINMIPKHEQLLLFHVSFK